MRTLRRREECHEAQGRNICKIVARAADTRVPANTTMAMPTVFDARYWDHTPEPFPGKSAARPGFTQGNNLIPSSRRKAP